MSSSVAIPKSETIVVCTRGLRQPFGADFVERPHRADRLRGSMRATSWRMAATAAADEADGSTISVMNGHAFC